MLNFKVRLPGADALQVPRAACAGALQEAGRAVQEYVRAHLESRPGRRYWRDAAKSAQLVVEGEEATIRVTHAGAALHYYGGVVLPGKGRSSKTGKPTRLLAIPKGTEEPPVMYAAPLAFVPVRGKPHLRGLLLPGQKRTARRPFRGRPAGREIVVPLPGAPPAYYLVDQTVHLPRPNVMPPLPALADTAQLATMDYLNDIDFYA